MSPADPRPTIPVSGAPEPFPLDEAEAQLLDAIQRETFQYFVCTLEARIVTATE